MGGLWNDFIRYRVREVKRPNSEVRRQSLNDLVSYTSDIKYQLFRMRAWWWSGTVKR